MPHDLKAAPETHPILPTEEKLKIAVQAAREKKALNVVALKVTHITSLGDYFVIASGITSRQVEAVADHIEHRLKEAYQRPLHMEGRLHGRWVLMDYGDIIIHVFQEDVREYYSLERLWTEAEKVEFPDADSSKE